MKNLKLNLGCGPRKLEGFENLDKNTGWRFQDGFDYKDDSVDAITISHALMFLTAIEIDDFLKEAYRVLKVGGVIRITEDDATNSRSSVFGGCDNFVTLTGFEMMGESLHQAKFWIYFVRQDKTYYKDKSLIQEYHGKPPRVFHIEGIKR